MPEKFSDSNASRIISALDARSDRRLRNGALVQTTWGTIGSLDAFGKVASAYLYGETDGAYMSGGFRVPEAMYLTVGDVVKVGINYATGERWIEEARAPSAYPELAIDLHPAAVFLGSGSTAFDSRLYRSAAKTLTIDDTAAGSITLNVLGVLQVNGSPVALASAIPSVPSASGTVVSETTFGLSSAVGSSAAWSKGDHSHGSPTDPVTAHAAAADPHTGYQKESEKDAVSGYAGLDSSSNLTKSLLLGGDTNLYRSAANTLKTDDAFQALSLAIGTNKVARFVEGAHTVAAATTRTSSLAQTLVELTSLPSTGVVAVCGRIAVRSSTTGGDTVDVSHYSGTTAGLAMATGVVNRDGATNFIAFTGGTNSRQINYTVNWSSGTVTYSIVITGYWTTE